MQKILIVEDDSDIQELLENHLIGAGYSVVSASDGVEALSHFSQQAIDLVLLDIMLPKIDGYGVCELIRKQSQVPIVMLTALDSETDQIKGLDLQIDDYITKPFGTDELRARVNAHLRRDSREKKNAFSISGIVFQLSAKEAEFQGEKLPLTKSEYEICEYLALHHGQTFTKEQIYEAVFGFDGESDSSVISTHIKNIRSKLTAYQLAPIETVWGVGYKWV